MRERHLCTTFKLYMNSFCRQRAARFKVLIKVISKAHRWMENENSFAKKIDFLLYFFSIIKNVFDYMFAKFSYQIRTHAISSSRSQILQRTGTSCLSNFGTRGNVSWLF